MSEVWFYCEKCESSYRSDYYCACWDSDPEWYGENPDEDEELVEQIAEEEGKVGACRNCFIAPTWAKDLCKTCLQYLWRTGNPRPPHLIWRNFRRTGLRPPRQA